MSDKQAHESDHGCCHSDLLGCRQLVKEKFTADPSANVMNYAKFTAVMAGSMALKQYLEDQKILPTSI